MLRIAFLEKISEKKNNTMLTVKSKSLSLHNKRTQ